MGGEKEKELILQSIELMRLIITGIPCNVESRISFALPQAIHRLRMEKIKDRLQHSKMVM